VRRLLLDGLPSLAKMRSFGFASSKSPSAYSAPIHWPLGDPEWLAKPLQAARELRSALRGWGRAMGALRPSEASSGPPAVAVAQLQLRAASCSQRGSREGPIARQAISQFASGPLAEVESARNDHPGRSTPML
jgi:hypothetical protein